MNEIEEKFCEDTKKRIDDVADREGNKLDKIIFAISTGPFILSISFIVGFSKKILVNPELLFISWVLLASSLIVHILSFVFVLEKIWKLDDKLLACRKRNNIQGIVEAIENFNKRTKITGWINYFAIILGIAGIVFLTYFALLNVNYNKMEDKVKGIEKSADENEIQKHAADNTILPLETEKPESEKQGADIKEKE